MKCRNCAADLADGTAKCPFCKELLNVADNPMFENFNFKYTITSEEQIKAIRDAANSRSSLVSVLKNRPKNRKRRKFVLRRKKNNVKDMSKKNVVAKFSKLSPQNKMYVFFYGSILLLIAIIIGIFFSVGAIVNRERVINPVVYSKGNSIYLLCDKKNVILTENTIDMNSVFTTLDGSETQKITEIMSKSDLIKNSENGMYTYYFENYDSTSSSGSLNRIFNGRAKRAVSNGVHNSYLLSPDGKCVLFLQSADKNGDMGNLCYWTEEMEEPVRIASDIDKNTFTFSNNGRYILYIRNYNYGAFGGDLCIVDTEKLESESIMIDSEVYAVFGTDSSEKKFIYAKNYDKDSKTYDLYTKTEKSDRVKVFEKASKTPLFAEKGNLLLTYAYSDGKMYSIYSVNLKNYDKTKITSQATEIIKTDDENKTVLYNKIYDNKIVDYYLYNRGNKTVKAADNIMPAPENQKGVNAFSCSENMLNAVYISGFDISRGGGTLYLSDLTKENENTLEIASDVYMCSISSDGKKIIYAKDYSAERDIFDLYLYQKGGSVLLKEEVDASYFGTSNSGNNICFMENYDMTGPYGILKVSDINGKETASFENVWAYDIYGENGVIFFTDYDTTEENWTVHINNGNSKKAKTIGTGIDTLLYY